MQRFKFRSKQLTTELEEIEENFKDFFNFKNQIDYFIYVVFNLILANFIFYPVLNLVNYLRFGVQLYEIDYILFFIFIGVFFGIYLLINISTKERRKHFVSSFKNYLNISKIINYILWYSIAYLIVNLILNLLFDFSYLLLYSENQFSIDTAITYIIAIIFLFSIAFFTYVILKLIIRKK